MVNKADIEYNRVLTKILQEGSSTDDRTGTGTLKLFGERMEFDLREGFPLLTTKKVFWRGLVHELLWFISGDTNIKYLTQHGVHIWDEWADDHGDLGPVYGAQWRHAGASYDQLGKVIEEIKVNPSSRRLIVNSWQVADLPEMALPPCHMMFQFNVEGEYIDLQLYQRSADMFLGVPFNIASYSLLLMMVAKECGLKPRKFIHILGDAHIYKNHIAQSKEVLQRMDYPAPTVELKCDKVFDTTFDDIVLHDYQCGATIKGEVSV